MKHGNDKSDGSNVKMYSRKDAIISMKKSGKRQYKATKIDERRSNYERKELYLFVIFIYVIYLYAPTYNFNQMSHN